ncbi:MAG: class I SAM-dependent methyltransferase [Ignavibacteriaceae bacterium]|nr:class I SAM-dependent methyltransferase [Ignavibacteriaceae bacterium]
MANKDFYRFAHAYDIAFSDRDHQDEYNFLIWCFNNFAKVENIWNYEKVFLEVACGPANQARTFAEQGWKAVGLDLSESMIEYARSKDKEAGVEIQYYAEDMTDFHIKEKALIVSNPLESISHILTNEGMVTHLRAVSNAMVKGGVYIIEGTHPKFFFPDNLPNTWTMREGDTEVDILFGLPEDEYDPVTQVWNVTTRLDIKQKYRKMVTTESKSFHRWYLAQEFKMLFELSGAFESIDFLGDITVPAPPLSSGPECESMFVVLRK